MNKKQPLSIAKRADIVSLHKVDFSKRKIAKRLHVNQSVVHAAASKFNTTRKYINLKKSGRSRKTNSGDDYVIQMMVICYPILF